MSPLKDLRSFPSPLLQLTVSFVSCHTQVPPGERETGSYSTSSCSSTPENRNGLFLFSKELIADEFPMGGGWVGVTRTLTRSLEKRLCRFSLATPPHPGTLRVPALTSHRGEREPGESHAEAPYSFLLPLRDGGGWVGVTCSSRQLSKLLNAI